MSTPAAAAAAADPLPRIGQTVRIRLNSACCSSCCRATVAYVDAAEGSVDVVYEDGGEWAGGQEEEGGVALGRIRALEPFEEAEAEEATAAEAVAGGDGGDGGAAALALAAAQRQREEANALFRLGDYGAALAGYRAALRRLLLAYPAAGAGAGVAAGEGGCCAGLRVGAWTRLPISHVISIPRDAT